MIGTEDKARPRKNDSFDKQPSRLPRYASRGAGDCRPLDLAHRIGKRTNPLRAALLKFLRPQMDAFAPGLRTYTLYVPSRDEGVSWWLEAAFQAARHDHLSRNEASSLLRAHATARSIRIFETSPLACALPTLVTDPRDHRIRAFLVQRADGPGAAMRALPLDVPSLERWRTSIFIPLENGALKRTPVPCPF